MTANLVREANTGSWIRVEAAEAMWCVRTVHASRRYSTQQFALPSCRKGTAWRECGLRLRSQQLGTKMYYVDLIKSWPKLASAEPGRLVTWSFGPHLSRGWKKGPTRNLPIR